MEGEDILETSGMTLYHMEGVSSPFSSLISQGAGWELSEAALLSHHDFQKPIPLGDSVPRLFHPQNQLASFQSQPGQNLLCLKGSSVGTSRNSLWKCMFALSYKEDKTQTEVTVLGILVKHKQILTSIEII